MENVLPVKTAEYLNWHWRLVFHLFFFFTFAAAQLAFKASSTATDLQALEDFRASLSAAGDTSILRTNWTGSTFCSWFGVKCNNGSRVVELILPANGLIGEIPPSLQNLTSLEFLDLHRNNLSGDIPSFIGNFSNIYHLDLSENALSGSVPKSICAQSLSATLGFFSLATNILSGTIPDALDRCLNLSGLYLGGNNLTGSIPDTIQSLGNLTTLDLSFNSLTGTIPRLPNSLEALSLRENKLTGNLSKQAGHLPDSLQLLSLSGNAFADEIPAEIGGLQNLTRLKLTNNSFHGSIPDTWQPSSLLDTLELGLNHLSGVIPSSIANLANLSSLRLDRNSLSGTIPSSIGNLSHLVIINLAENQLAGNIPPELANLSQLSSLNLSWNNLSGVVPEGLFTLPKLVDIIFDNNTFLSQDPAGAPAPADRAPSISPTLAFSFDDLEAALENSWTVRIILIIDGLLAVVDACFLCLYACQRFHTPKELPVVEKVLPVYEPSIECTVTLDELRRITSNFRDDNVIGIGARSIVYKGIVGGAQVAVKVLRTDNAAKSRETLLRELQTLGRVRHRNLLRILAVCHDMETRALVLEFMPFSSLYHFLYGMVGSVCLSWYTRFNILMGVAQGLVYLHREHQEPIIHCDLKPSNILLDSDFEPKVADFGIARYVEGDFGSASVSGLCGTIGYIPPEYAWGTPASTKGDVFSFGIVLLEILTARKPYEGWDVEPGQPGSLVELVASSYPDNIMSILDPNMVVLELDGGFHQLEVRTALNIGLMCTEVYPKNRPDMIVVLELLTEIKVSRCTSGLRKYPKIEQLVQLPTLWDSQDDPATRVLPESEETNLELWIAKKMP